MMYIVPVYDGDYPYFLEHIFITSKKEIIIVSFLVSGIEKYIKLLSNKIYEGVEIYLITNTSFKSIIEYRKQIRTIKKLSDIGVKTYSSREKKTEHRKVVIGDSYRILLGSHNITEHSFKKSKELSLYIENKDLAERIKRRIFTGRVGSCFF